MERDFSRGGSVGYFLPACVGAWARDIEITSADTTAILRRSFNFQARLMRTRGPGWSSPLLEIPSSLHPQPLLSLAVFFAMAPGARLMADCFSSDDGNVHD